MLRRDERGAVTAELAMGLPLLAVSTLGLVWLMAVAATQVRTVDAAREVARAVARGDEVAGSVQLGEQVAPQGSRVEVEESGGRVTVTVTGRVAGPGGVFAGVPAARVRATAVAVVEGASGEEGVP